MTCHKVHLQLIALSYNVISKNIKVKARSECHNESTWFKGSIPRNIPIGTWKNSEITRRASVMKYFFNKITNIQHTQSVKSVRIRTFSGLYFPTFGLNTERYGVSLRI